MDRVIEIGHRQVALGTTGDWFVRIQDGSRPADYVEFVTETQASQYAGELRDEFSHLFDMAE
jgi:hypothetical protein